MIALIFSFWMALAHADTLTFSAPTTIPLSYTRIVNSAVVTGLTVKVSVVNAATNATLLASTTVTESATGSGVYTYLWTPLIYSDTLCVVTYTVGTAVYKEHIYISYDGLTGRGA